MRALDLPLSGTARRVLFQVHLWVGLAAGAYVLAVSLSGSLLVFRIELQRATFPELFTPRVAGEPATPEAILDSVARAFPDERISGIDAPTTLRPTYLAYTSGKDRFRTVLLDPVSAELLGELPDESVVRVIQNLHFDLLGGRKGRVVNGVGAALLLGMCVTGIVLWWPGRRRWTQGLKVDVSRPWRRINWDLHHAAGAWTLVFVAMWAVTGIYFAFPRPFRAAIQAVSPLSVARAPLSVKPESGEAAALPAPAQIERARRLMPGRHVARVVLPSSDRAAFLVMFADVRPTPPGTTALTSVYLDQYSGARLTEPEAARTWGDEVLSWIAPLHVGSFGGPVVRVVWLVLGAAPALLAVTGFFMWWVRVVRPRRVRAVSPAAEGART